MGTRVSSCIVYEVSESAMPLLESSPASPSWISLKTSGTTCSNTYTSAVKVKRRAIVKWVFISRLVCVSSSVQIGFYVIYTLLDVVAESFSQHLHHLITLFQHGLNDPESKEVRTSTLR